MDETTAYHEAGHALMAIVLGGRIESLTIAPEADDVPKYGEVQIAWPANWERAKRGIQGMILVALAGPVAEMIISGDQRHPALVSEWAHDWQAAWKTAAAIAPNERRRLELLEQITHDLHRRLSRDDHWAALAAIVDHLLAYDSLEDDQVREILESWLDIC